MVPLSRRERLDENRSRFLIDDGYFLVAVAETTQLWRSCS